MKPIGKKLMEVLREDQMIRLLDSVFMLLDDQETEKLFSDLDEDIADPLSQILSSETEEIISEEKSIEDKWQELWRDWSDIESEVGDEDGEYVSHDKHQETPYFDSLTLAEDLDEVAEEMLPLLEEIYASGAEEDDAFENAVLDLEDAIKTYPERMGTEDSTCVFEAATTACVLQWRWLVSDSATSFLENIIQLEDELEIISLEDATVISFILDMSEEDRTEIYEYITAHRDEAEWSKRLVSEDSEWKDIYYVLSENFGPGDQPETPDSMLTKDWRHGLSLIKDLLKEKDLAAAEKMYEKTVASFIRGEEDHEKDWHPEESLLISALTDGYETENDVIRLLKDWTGVTEKLKMPERTAALKIQAVTYQTPHNWDKVRKVVQQTDMSAVSHLLEQWEIFILKSSLGDDFGTGKRSSHNSWIMWLMEVSIDETKEKPWFTRRLNNWLTALLKDSKKFQNQQTLVRILTQDLAGMSDLKKKYPRLSEAAKTRSGQKDNTSRRNWLKKIGGQKFVPLLTDCWIKHAVNMVPNPADTAHSKYDVHALWLSVVNEVDPQLCERILNRWRKDHKRRKNLWRALRKKKLG
ncbi:hypothetical protein QUF72_19645 [Desulfobacterales bacterium HSG2]|nr:hypothetical protein [Desulfobacterales bacterium HSG2]